MNAPAAIAPLISAAHREAAGRAKLLRSLVRPLHEMILMADIGDRQRAICQRIVDESFARGRQFVRVMTLDELVALWRGGDSMISDAFNGCQKKDSCRVPGLVELGMVSRRRLPDGNGKSGGWLVELQPDWSRWRCRWDYTVAERALRVLAADARALEYERQCVAGEIEDRFILAALLRWNDVENALTLAGADAPRIAPRAAGRTRFVRPSEIPKRKTLGNGAGFGISEVARAASSSGTKSSKSALTLSVEQLKDLIRSGRENDFVQAMQAMIPTHERGDGGKWRAKWRRAELNPFVVAMFEGIIEKIAEGNLRRPVALEAHFYWKDFGGHAAEEKLRNLLIT